MPRLTKSDIESALLSGAAVSWTESGGKSTNIQLATAKQRRLFAYLRNSKIRDVKGLSQTFIDELSAAYVAVGDPAAANVQRTINPSASGPWKIKFLKIEGFGGVNIWNGKPFERLARPLALQSWQLRTRSTLLSCISKSSRPIPNFA